MIGCSAGLRIVNPHQNTCSSAMDNLGSEYNDLSRQFSPRIKIKFKFLAVKLDGFT